MSNESNDQVEKMLFAFTLNMIGQVETLDELIKIVKGAEISRTKMYDLLVDQDD